MIVDELAYRITVKADDFLNGKRKVESGANEMRNNLRRTSNESTESLGKLTFGFSRLGQAGDNAFKTVQTGAAKFLGVALTLEGARRMFSSTTTDLVRLGNVSSFLGMSATSLQGFERAATAVGVSSQSMTNSLARVKNAQLWSRTGMGAPDESTVAIQQLQGMTGTDIIGAATPGEGLLRQAQALRKLNKDQAQVMWQRMGGADEMFNLMFSGNLGTLQKDFEKQSNATPAAIKQAMDVTKTLEELKATADSVGQEFVRIFGKGINDALSEFGEWVKNNKDNILGFFQDGSKWAKDFADALNGSSNALHSFFQITENFNLLTGFNKPIIDIPGISDKAGQVSIPKDIKIDPSNPFGLTKSNQNPYDNGYTVPAGGYKDSNSGPGIIDEVKSYMQDERLKRLKTEDTKALTPEGTKGLTPEGTKGLTPGATNPELAYPQSKQNNDWFSDLLRSMGIGSAGAAITRPSFIKHGENMLSSTDIGNAGSAMVSPEITRRGDTMLNNQVGSSLLDALAMTESGGNPLAYNSKSGATGMYQFMPGTARDMGLKVGNGVDERLDPEKSRAAASAYLSQLIKRYKGNVTDALQAYNWGMGNMDKYIAAGRSGFMPKETQDYPVKVAKYYQQMTNTALAPRQAGYNQDNSQTSTTNIGTVQVNSNPTSVDQLTQSIEQQAQRSHITVSFSSGVNPS